MKLLQLQLNFKPKALSALDFLPPNKLLLTCNPKKPPNNRTAEQLIQYCKQKPFCQIRFIPYHPKTVFGIYDKKEVFIIVFSETDLPESPALWSNNRSLIALAENYFETLWNTTMENY